MINRVYVLSVSEVFGLLKMYFYMYVCTHVNQVCSGSCGGRKKSSNPPGLELQEVMRGPLLGRVLGTELRFY